jgi:SAM-dependent methyltransferase
MTSTDAAGPNADQVAYWNKNAGPTWVAMQNVLDAQLGGLGLVAIETLAPRPGETLIDIGCGCGDTSLELARRVGPTGRVLGADISGPMLQVARSRAAALGLDGASFTQADAQTHAFPPVDGAFSRFGVMFFADPPAAFANIRRAFRPGGRLAFVCWRSLGENPWMTVPFMAAASLLPPQAPLPPDAPGPFAFADRDRLLGILRAAGFTEIAIEPHDAKLGWGDVESGVRAALNLGPLGRALLDSPHLKEAVTGTVRNALAAHADKDGDVRLDSASWIVLAR